MSHVLDPTQRGVDGGTARLNYGDPAPAMTPRRAIACGYCPARYATFSDTEEHFTRSLLDNAWRQVPEDETIFTADAARFPALVSTLRQEMATRLSGLALALVA